MMRSIVAIVTGLIVASAVIAAGEFLRMRLASAPVAYGASDGTEAEIERSRRRLKNVSTLIGQGRYQDAYFLAESMVRDLPLSQLVAVLLSCAIGTVPGAWLAASLARRAPKLHGLAVGTSLLAVGIVITFEVPHLLWYWAPGEAILLPAAYLGARLTVLKGKNHLAC